MVLEELTLNQYASIVHIAQDVYNHCWFSFHELVYTDHLEATLPPVEETQTMQLEGMQLEGTIGSLLDDKENTKPSATNKLDKHKVCLIRFCTPCDNLN